MQKYRLISKKGEGTFSEVLKAQSIKTGKYVAIKCMKNHFESIEQVSRICAIKGIKHPIYPISAAPMLSLRIAEYTALHECSVVIYFRSF